MTNNNQIENTADALRLIQMYEEFCEILNPSLYTLTDSLLNEQEEVFCKNYGINCEIYGINDDETIQIVPYCLSEQAPKLKGVLDFVMNNRHSEIYLAKLLYHVGTSANEILQLAFVIHSGKGFGRLTKFYTELLPLFVFRLGDWLDDMKNLSPDFAAFIKANKRTHKPNESGTGNTDKKAKHFEKTEGRDETYLKRWFKNLKGKGYISKESTVEAWLFVFGFQPEGYSGPTTIIWLKKRIELYHTIKKMRKQVDENGEWIEGKKRQKWVPIIDCFRVKGKNGIEIINPNSLKVEYKEPLEKTLRNAIDNLDL